jgi:ubiquinone/menaquinone biosynthesis C-methylase UbiE
MTSSSGIVVEAFTELAPRYVETVDRELRTFWGVGYQDFIHLLLEAAPVDAGALILDLATGTAQIPLSMARSAIDGCMIVGLDITPTMLRYGLANLRSQGASERVRLICASAMDMPFEADAFDLAICGLATHHMHVPRLLSEAQRVLKPGGRLVMADVSAPPFCRSALGSIMVRCAAVGYSLAHRDARGAAEVAAIPNVRTTQEWRTLLAHIGFMDVELVAELHGRRLLFPGGVVWKATKPAR